LEIKKEALRDHLTGDQIAARMKFFGILERIGDRHVLTTEAGEEVLIDYQFLIDYRDQVEALANRERWRKDEIYARWYFHGQVAYAVPAARLYHYSKVLSYNAFFGFLPLEAVLTRMEALAAAHPVVVQDLFSERWQAAGGTRADFQAVARVVEMYHGYHTAGGRRLFPLRAGAAAFPGILIGFADFYAASRALLTSPAAPRRARGQELFAAVLGEFESPAGGFRGESGTKEISELFFFAYGLEEDLRAVRAAVANPDVNQRALVPALGSVGAWAGGIITQYANGELDEELAARRFMSVLANAAHFMARGSSDGDLLVAQKIVALYNGHYGGGTPPDAAALPFEATLAEAARYKAAFLLRSAYA